MTWLFAVIAAQFALGSSLIIDKLILKKAYHNPLGYTFWLGVLGLSGLALIPFGMQSAGINTVLLALLAGIIFIFAILFLYLTLFRGEASDAVPLIGAFSPLFTLLASFWLLGLGLNTIQILAFVFLVAGGIVLASTETKKLRLKMFALAAVSAALFGLTNTLTKAVFLETNFITGFVWIKIGGALAAIFLLLIPGGYKEILHPKSKDEFHHRGWYLFNRGLAGLGSILVYFALSLGPPPLVDATGKVQFVFVFLGGWLILKERFRGWALAGKIIAVALISFGIFLIGAYDYLANNQPNPDRPIVWGVTFSEKFSKLMVSSDWRKNYEAILYDLNVKHLRLVAYWDLIGASEGEFRFDDLDYQMNEAEKAGAEVILVVGRKVPRWPECHEPSWAQNEKLLKYIEVVVNRYKNHPALVAWQVENEPFLRFGECPPLDVKLLDKEVALVKSLAGTRPVIVTDSGELSTWYQAASRGDVFGTTMYRRVYNRFFGFIDYHLPPEFFRMKEWFSRAVTGENEKPYIVIELGAEPWLLRQLYETEVKDQLAVFDLPFFKDTISYAKSAGFDEYYLWGAEWWYWMKTRHGDGSFWDYAKTLFRPTP